jgi:phenylalanyl-tRNA synthetase beta chain
MDERSAVRWLEATGWEGNATARITNPISEAMAVLRPRLLASLVPSLVVNVNRRRGEIRLYEVGVGFTLRAGEPRPAETLRVAGAWSGHAVGPSWDGPGRPADYYDARGLAEAFFDALGLGPPEFRPSGAALFRGATGADLWWRGSQLGWLGEMGPALRQACGVRQEAVLFEWSLEPLVEGWQGVERRHRGLPRFPAVERDIALVVKESAPQGAVERLLRQEGASLLESLRLFDVYRGEPLPAGRKSLAYTMVLRAADRTLTEEEAQELRARIGQRAARELGATLRE